MNIIKLQHPSDYDATNCSDALVKANVKCIRRGSAVVALTDMQNINTVGSIVDNNHGELVKASDSDEFELMGSI
jgi:metal-dependent HD superfamily phosphatase/phosphodiesterase